MVRAKGKGIRTNGRSIKNSHWCSLTQGNTDRQQMFPESPSGSKLPGEEKVTATAQHHEGNLLLDKMKWKTLVTPCIPGTHLEVLIYAEQASWPTAWLVFLRKALLGEKLRKPAVNPSTHHSLAVLGSALPEPDGCCPASGAPEREGTSGIRGFRGLSSSKKPRLDSKTAKIWALDGATPALGAPQANTPCVPLLPPGSRAPPSLWCQLQSCLDAILSVFGQC